MNINGVEFALPVNAEGFVNSGTLTEYYTAANCGGNQYMAATLEATGAEPQDTDADLPLMMVDESNLNGVGPVIQHGFLFYPDLTQPIVTIPLSFSESPFRPSVEEFVRYLPAVHYMGLLRRRYMRRIR